MIGDWRILRASDYRTMAWKNGGGTTAEIARWPEAAAGDFHWRLSMATVASDGPFSVFPDVDRSLAVLDGLGMELTIAVDPPVRLTSESDPFGFAGDRPAHARLLGGPVVDLNIMTVRDRCRHAMRRARVPRGDTLRLGHEHHLVLVEAGAVEASSHHATAMLAARDTLIASGGAVELAPMGSAATLIVICIEAP